MAELIVVRHAQASFGTDDYDRLSELGHLQSRWLGEHLALRDTPFDRVITGSLRRHRETLEGLRAGGVRAPEAEVAPALDEYESEVLLGAHLSRHGLPWPAAGADRREHFRLLRDALAGWCDGTLPCPGHRSFEAFAAGIRDTLAPLCAAPRDARILIVSSGGPISTMIATTIGAPARAMIELNLQLRNASISEFRAGPRGVACVSFNGIPHLDTPARREHVTWS